jgi:two-component system sensor histidine kinase HydH
MERPPLADASRSLRRVRWAQVLVYSGLALALLVTAFQSWLDVERVRAEVTGAQGRRLLFALGRTLEDEQPVTSASLDRALRAFADDGLRCVIVLRRGGAPRIQAGDCRRPAEALQEAAESARPGTVLDVDDLVALASDPPPPGPGPGPGHPPPPHAGVDRPGGPPGPPPDWMPPPHPPGEPPPPPPGPGPWRRPRLLIVYEPVEANALRQSATRSLAVALLTVLALIGATIVLWRLARRAEALQATAERDRTLVTLGEMSAVLAHEIRNPLAALKGHAQLLVERLSQTGSERKKAERLVHESRRLERLVDDLLSFVRASRVAPAPAEPAAVLRDAVQDVAPDRVDVDTGGAPASWRLDASRVRQALANLLRNAVEASPEGARVSATAEANGHELVFRIRDHGPGLPPGDPDHLFEPFHTTRVHGTGLGLAVARRIAELHGGRVAARTHPAGGAEFSIVIP